MIEVSDVEIDVDANVVVLTRLKTLQRIAQEFCIASRGGERIVNMVAEGIRTKAISLVEFILSNSDGEDCGYTAFGVDWEKYAVQIVRGEEYDSFPVDIGKSVSSQVSVPIANLIAYITEKAEENDVQSVQAVFSYENVDAVAHRRFAEKYHLTAISGDIRERLDRQRDNGRYAVSLVDNKNLGEVSAVAVFKL